ncbi:hypothetical protein ACMFMG_000453 [Clarireedia jacksonii]
MRQKKDKMTVSNLQPDEGGTALGEDSDTVDTRSSASSDGSRHRAHNIQPTWPSKVAIKTPALASWQATRLDNIFLHINWAPRGTSGSAFFKLRTPLRFEGGPSTGRDGLSNVFIFIHPERIRQLSFNIKPDEKPFGPNTVTFEFSMNRAPALVLPRTYDSISPEVEEVMKSLRKLATQLTFTIYVSVSRRTLPASWIQQLCTAVTDHKLSPILACANLSTLYLARGAQLLEGDDLPERFSTPPTYDDVGPCPPDAVQSERKGQKRRRSSSESESESGSDHQPMSYAAVKALLDTRLATHKREVVEILAAHKDQVLQLLDDLKTELDQKLDTREEQLVADRLTDLVAQKVQEEMVEVEDHLLDTITSMPLQASLTFPEHLHY